MPWQRHSDDFPFDNQILAQAIIGGYRIGEVSVPTRYFPEASSINFGGTTRFVVSFFRVFAPTLRIRRASTRFLAALALQALANTGLLALLMHAGLDVWPAQVATTVALTFVTYAGYRLWVCR